MKLHHLYLRNFKGIKELDINFMGKNFTIYGDNGTGKTTIFDAFLWLLFDKDSQNSSNFNIKTLDENGNVIHGLEHEVKAHLDIQGTIVELQKIYKEKWSKKKRQAEKELTGHTTDYFIDGVPKRKKDYTEFLEKIIDEETFRILTNPLYFNTKLDWKKRREVIMNLAEEVDSVDVLNVNKKLKELQVFLSETSIEDLKAKTQAQRRKANKELEQVPVRIDELSRGDAVNIDYQQLKDEKEKIKKERETLIANQLSVSSEEIQSIKQSSLMIQKWLHEFEQSKTATLKNSKQELEKTLWELEKKHTQMQLEIRQYKNQVVIQQDTIQQLEERVDEYRKQYLEVNAQVFGAETQICPTCGQALPPESIQQHREEFEIKKTERLQKITAEATKLKETINQTKQNIQEQKNNQEQYERQVTDIEAEIKTVEFSIQEVNRQLESITFTDYEEYQSKQVELDQLQDQLTILLEDQASEDKTQEIKRLDQRLQQINEQLAQQQLIESNKNRVQELMARERELAQFIAQLEKREFLCDQFIITKTELLEDKLNHQFELVKFKLFNQLVNGGIEETFVTTVNGVPFDDLNSAMKINAGLDIINTLTDYYHFTAPIFIDNRESVNVIPNMKSQIINLVVTKDKKLKFEEANIHE